MYLPLKFPNSILIKIIEEFHKNTKYQKYRLYERGPVLLKLNERLQAENFQACFFILLLADSYFDDGFPGNLMKYLVDTKVTVNNLTYSNLIVDTFILDVKWKAGVSQR